MNLKKPKIAIIGLGYVGLPLALEFGKIHDVVGFDVDSNKIKNLNNLVNIPFEITKQDLLRAKFLSLTTKSLNLSSCNFYIITVPTPVNSKNKPDLSFLKNASETVARLLEPGNFVIYESTVYPGLSRRFCVPILEKISGLKCIQSENDIPNDSGFHLGYSPERINPGDNNNSLVNVVKVTSGSSIYSAKIIDDLYKSIIKAGTFSASSIEVAEASKILENTQRDVNIAFMNEMAQFFQIMGIDTNDVLKAASTKWNFIKFSPGFVGGHCIGVDPYYLISAFEKIGLKSPLIDLARSINENMAYYAADKILMMMKKNNSDLPSQKIGLFGFTFKDDCKDIRNSKIYDLYLEFYKNGCIIDIIDPIADPHEVMSEYGIQLITPDENRKYDVLIFAVCHKEFTNYSIDYLLGLYSKNYRPILADLKSIFDKKLLEKSGFDIFRL